MPKDHASLEQAMNVIGSQIGELSVNIADTSGMVSDVSNVVVTAGRGVSFALTRTCR
jgi:hypothetical protein